jgi:hypothetical protein
LSPSRKDEKSDDEKDTKDTSGPTSTKRREKKKRKVPAHEVEDIRAVEEADEDEVKRGLNDRQTSNRQIDKQTSGKQTKEINK